MDADLLRHLRVLASQIQAGQQEAQLGTIERIGLERLFDVETLVCALTVGGVGFAGFISDLATDCASEPERYRKILEVCQAEASNRDPRDVALKLVAAFGVEGAPEAFLRTIQRELTIFEGAPIAAIQAAEAEMKEGRWAMALTGFIRVCDKFGDKTPRLVRAHAARCLHKLGKYAQAEEMNLRGLGAQRDLIALKASAPPEGAIVRDWQPAAPPVISILCVAYNQERYIDGAIRGFLTQRTEFSFEILIHDDASTDGTAAKIRAWQEKYPSIIHPVLQTENQYSRGVEPFDLLLKQARGRYIALCEGDDYWLEPAKLQKQVSFLEQNPDFSCSAHNYYLYNESEPSVRRWHPSVVDRMLTPAQLMAITRLLWCPTVVFRKLFTTFPPERYLASLGDQFLTSYLGTFGSCAYLDSFVGSVRRQNQYSIWTPVADQQKERARVRTWAALLAFHERLGNHDAASSFRKRIDVSPLDPAEKSTLLEAVRPSPAALAPAT
jgi:glycosyltransferase involved in cell wall biosynthesis